MTTSYTPAHQCCAGPFQLTAGQDTPRWALSFPSHSRCLVMARFPPRQSHAVKQHRGHGIFTLLTSHLPSQAEGRSSKPKPQREGRLSVRRDTPWGLCTDHLTKCIQRRTSRDFSSS